MGVDDSGKIDETKLSGEDLKADADTDEAKLAAVKIAVENQINDDSVTVSVEKGDTRARAATEQYTVTLKKGDTSSKFLLETEVGLTDEAQAAKDVELAKKVSVTATHAPGKFNSNVNLGDLKIKDLDSLKVSLVQGENNETTLVTNTLNETGFSENGDAHSISTPFNMGSDANTKWAWDRGAYDIDDSTLDQNWPDKILVEFKINGVSYEAESTVASRN